MNKQTIGLILAGVLVLIGGIALMVKSSPENEIKSVAFTVAAKQAPAETIFVKQGQTVRITLNSEVDGEAHLHDYDIYTDLKAGESAESEFVANLIGEFELENHETEELIAVFKVLP